MEFEESANIVLRRLPEVDQEYLDTAFHNYYVDYGAPPETLADLCEATEGSGPEAVTGLLEDLRKVLISAVQRNKVDLFWDIATKLGRSERYFLGLVYMGVSQAIASGRIADKIIGLLSCQLYLSLMLVPKTGVNLLFPSLLQSCLSMLSLPVSSSGSPTSSSLLASEKKRSRSVSTDSRSVTVDDEVYPIETLQDYVEHITEALDSLRAFLTNVSLEEHDDVVSALCQHMALITENEMLGQQAYEVLSALCDRNGLHGDLSELLKLISFKLNGNLLMLRASLKDQVPRAMVKARDSSLRFLMDMRERVENDDYLVVTIQQLAMRSLEKADIRFRTAQGVLQLVLQLEAESLTRTLHWFHKMIRSKIPRHRMFSLELFGQICSLQRTPQALRGHFSNIALAALERVMDDLATVKAKAFAFFAQLTNTPHWMDNLVTSECSHEDVIGALLGILNECVKDSKVHVRKSALNVLNGILCGDTEFDKGPYVDVIVRCCRDQTILVRKHALECLLKVYRRHPTYYKEFVSGVFPLTMDNEPSVQEKALACILDVVFDSILPGRDEDSAWNVLRHLGTYERYLPSICEQLCKKEGKIQLDKQHLRALVLALNGSPNASWAWKLLSYLCNHTHVDLSGFNDCDDQLDDDAECCRLSVLFTQSKQRREKEHYQDSLLTILNDPTTSFMRLAHVCSILLHLDRPQLVRWTDVTFPNSLAVMEQAVKDDAGNSSLVSEDDLLSAMFKAGECVLVLPNLANLHLCTLLRTIVQESKQPLAVRRMALRVLGQISLVSVDLAKRLVGLIGDTVDNADDLSLRVIGIRTVADLSCRYATLTDSLLPVVYCLLKDPETEVRRAAITNLLQLLKEEYIKLRNNFLYHMLECVLDEDEMLRDLSEFGLDQFVLKRNPNLFLHNFIDCVFHLNAYRGHSLYNQVLQTPREMQTFSLVGQPSKRQVIYRFMVRRLTDEHKFLLTLNICNNVLKAIVDNETAVDRECPAIVIDLLEVLCMDELRLRVSSRGDEEEAGTGFAGEDNNGTANAPTTPSTRHTRKKEQFILNAIKLKTMIESILPPLTMLKSRCEDNEELMTALMSYLNVLNHEYKNELKALLVGNSASEFYSDLKKFEASRTRLDDTVASSPAEDPQQESKMKLIMKVLQSARKQQRAILNRDQEHQQQQQQPAAAADAASMAAEPVAVSNEELMGVSEATGELTEEIRPPEAIDNEPLADVVASSEVEGQPEVPDDLAREIAALEDAAEAAAAENDCSYLDTKPTEKAKVDVMELSGVEPLIEDDHLELERLRLGDPTENGILVVEENPDTQQSINENALNGVVDNEEDDYERDLDEDNDLRVPPAGDDSGRSPQLEDAPSPKAVVSKGAAYTTTATNNNNNNNINDDNAVEQNGLQPPLNGYTRGRTRKRSFREDEATAEHEVADSQPPESLPNAAQGMRAPGGVTRARKRRRSASTASSASRVSRASHNSKRFRQDVNETASNSNHSNHNDEVNSPVASNPDDTPSSRVPSTPRRSVSKRSRDVYSESVLRLGSALIRSRSNTTEREPGHPSRSGSVDSRPSSTVSSLVSTRSSVRQQRNAAAASSLEARWRHEHNLKPCEVMIIRNPVVEICAKEMRATGQSSFRMVAKVPHRASPQNEPTIEEDDWLHWGRIGSSSSPPISLMFNGKASSTVASVATGFASSTSANSLRVTLADDTPTTFSSCTAKPPTCDRRSRSRTRRPKDPSVQARSQSARVNQATSIRSVSRSASRQTDRPDSAADSSLTSSSRLRPPLSEPFIPCLALELKKQSAKSEICSPSASRIPGLNCSATPSNGSVSASNGHSASMPALTSTEEVASRSTASGLSDDETSLCCSASTVPTGKEDLRCTRCREDSPDSALRMPWIVTNCGRSPSTSTFTRARSRSSSRHSKRRSRPSSVDSSSRSLTESFSHSGALRPARVFLQPVTLPPSSLEAYWNIRHQLKSCEVLVVRNASVESYAEELSEDKDRGAFSTTGTNLEF